MLIYLLDNHCDVNFMSNLGYTGKTTYKTYIVISTLQMWKLRLGEVERTLVIVECIYLLLV